MGFLSGVMAANIKDSSKTIIFKVSDITYGWMDDNMKDIGKITKCMEEVSSSGLMVDAMMENMLLIRRKDVDNSVGQMEDVTREVGKMVNKMEKECTQIKKESREKVFGLMVKRSDGSTEYFDIFALFSIIIL